MSEQSASPMDQTASPGGDQIAHLGAAGDHHLPVLSLWPAACAAGVALLAFGVVTTLAFSVAGALVLAVAIGGWVGELRRE